MQITHACAVTTLMRMRVIDIPYVTLRMRGKHIRDVIDVTTSPRYSLQRGVSHKKTSRERPECSVKVLQIMSPPPFKGVI